jgi:hypothetical protein
MIIQSSISRCTGFHVHQQKQSQQAPNPNGRSIKESNARDVRDLYNMTANRHCLIHAMSAMGAHFCQLLLETWFKFLMILGVAERKFGTFILH